MDAETEVDVYYMAADNNDYALEAAAVVQAEEDLKRGPWTVEEDLVLVNYIANHGEGRWNSLARCAGLKRTGKSCRLRWLNYLRPDVRRGNITPEEQLLILDLHSRWGNRWSKIAQHLPGRTDNEIKNYWRTRVQRHAKQLKCDVNSQKFKDIMRHLWMPRLMERIRASSGSSTGTANPCALPVAATVEPVQPVAEGFEYVERSPDNSSTGGSLSDSLVPTHLLSPPVSDITFGSYGGADEFPAGQMLSGAGSHSESLPNPCWYFNHQEFPDFEHSGWGAAADGFSPENLWKDDDFWFLQEQLL